MKVILKKAVTGLGGPGTVKEVADGYARNFLIANGLAVMATTGQLQEMESQKLSRAKGSAEHDAKLTEVLSKLPEVNLVFKRKATPTDKLFAAVSAETIAEELSKVVKWEVSPAMLVIAEPVKSVGEHIVKLHSGDKSGDFRVTVEKE